MMSLILQLNRSARMILWWLVLVSISGCSENDISDLTNYIKSVNARPKSHIKPLAAQKIVNPYIFNTDGLRDPFRPVNRISEEADVQLASGSGLHPDFTRRKEELESYPLASLRLVGNLKMAAVLWGLIKADDGTIHRVHKGNYMGRNHGKITEITEDGIELMEIVPGVRKGLWREQQQSLALTE